MRTVFYQDWTESKALFQPTEVVKPVENFPEICISTFSKQIIDKFAALDKVEVIAKLYTANGENPIYKISYGGREFAFYLSLVGAPACVCGLEEVIAMGAKKFIFFGSCGVLDDEKVQRHIIVPSAVVREEGTSYHYLAPGEEIEPDWEAGEILKKCLRRCGYSYVCGKIWTSDAIYRETVDQIEERKKDGCLAVDMEYSALLAAARYRNVLLIQFFYGADTLDGGEWQPRDLADNGLSNAEKYLALALECGLEL